MPDPTDRKDDHLDLCATDRVAFRRKSTLLEDVDLVHDALSELHIDDVDLRTMLCGRVLRAPLIITGMTGGISRSEAMNRDLASIAQEFGFAFGFGSMRPLLERGERSGFFVRDVAPDAVLLGNIGLVQAREAGAEALVDLVGKTGCDALCVHLNPAMELIQRTGDRDFRGGLDALAHLREALPVPIIVKETGCGISRSVGERLVSAGISWVDVAGAGGTSWVGVETLRTESDLRRDLGNEFWDWGIPTAASVAQLSGLRLGIIASGGIHSGLDIVRALALGAVAGGLARPFLQAWNEGGRDGAFALAKRIIEEIRIALLLAGSRTPADVERLPLVLGPNLERWIPADSPLRKRFFSAR